MTSPHPLSDNVIFRKARQLGDQAARYKDSPAIQQQADDIKRIGKSNTTSPTELLNATSTVAKLCGHPLGIGSTKAPTSPPTTTATTPAVSDTGTAASPSRTPATSTSASTTPHVGTQVSLSPPGGGSKAVGVANVVTQQGQRGIALVGQYLPPTGKSFAYAMWLENSPSDAERLGFFGAVNANGRLQGFVLTPSDFARFSKIVVTRETKRDPKVPGTVVLTGNLRQ